MSKKYNTTPKKPKNNTPIDKGEKQDNITKPNETVEPIDDKEKSIEQQHKEFRDNANPDPDIKSSQSNEPILETDVNKSDTAFHPFQAPTKERDYTKLGYDSKAANATNKNTTEPKATPTNDGGNFDAPPPPTDEFSAEPPPMDDDPNYAQEPTIETGEPGGAFNMPTGTAEEVVDFGAKTLNALIGNFAGLLVGIKIKPEYYSIKDNRERASDIIKEHNVQSVEKLKFDSEDISMLKPPLVKMMKEKGIRGLTTGEELMIAVIVVASKKVKAVSEIRGMNKKLEARFSAMVANMQPVYEKETPETKENKKDDNEEIPLVEVEEVN